MKFVRLAFLLFLPVALASAATPDYATARFTDPDREKRLQSVLPEVDRIFADFAKGRHAPGLVWGLVLDGRLVHTGATGFANLEKKIAASATDTRFRIASMTKSITALAILKLRDAGKLSLDDPAEKHLPDLRHVARLTSDAPPITIRHLLTMSAGFPEDNPWGDRQLADTVGELRTFLRAGASLSNAAGVTYEYSNLGYALLGQIISNLAGEPYQRYITRELLQPLGMKDTVWEFSEVPADKLALGYRWENNAWSLEPLLHDGTYGAMGGLLTTLPDFARYVAFHLDAWPARNAPETGPVRRASVREMQKPAVISSLATSGRTLANTPNPQAVGYGYGLRWTLDSQRVISLGHGGGLPGFGSYHTFFPDHGFAIISFANVTYAGTGIAHNRVAPLLLEKAALPARTTPPSATLASRKSQIAELVQSWNPQLAAELAAENFFPDRSLEAWRRHARETLARLGTIGSVGEIVAENQLRGTFPILGENGRVDVFFTLTPEATPKLQQLRLTFVPKK